MQVLVGLVAVEIWAIVTSGDNIQVSTGVYIPGFITIYINPGILYISSLLSLAVHYVAMDFFGKIFKTVEAIKEMSR